MRQSNKTTQEQQKQAGLKNSTYILLKREHQRQNELI